MFRVPYSDLTLSAGWQEVHPACATYPQRFFFRTSGDRQPRRNQLKFTSSPRKWPLKEEQPPSSWHRIAPLTIHRVRYKHFEHADWLNCGAAILVVQDCAADSNSMVPVFHGSRGRSRVLTVFCQHISLKHVHVNFGIGTWCVRAIRVCIVTETRQYADNGCYTHCWSCTCACLVTGFLWCCITGHWCCWY